MTTSSYSPAPTYSISGTGPYDMPFEYKASDQIEVLVVTTDEAEITLAPSDFTVVPTGPATSGTVFLTPAVAALYDGDYLTIARDTTVQQDWTGLASTAAELESQLDDLTRAVQDNRAEIERSFDASGLWRTNVAELLLDNTLAYTPGLATTVVAGRRIRTLTEGFAYEVAEDTATDHQIATAGGVKLYVLPTPQGTLSADSFGAVGDGVTDDTAALNAFLAALNDFGGVVTQLPTGQLSSGAVYRVTDTLTLSRSAILDGQGATIVSEVDDPLKAAFYVGDPTTNIYRGQLKDFSLTFLGTSQSAGIQLERYLLGRLENVYVSNFNKNILLSSESGDPFIGWLDLDKVYTQGGDYGVYGSGVPANVVSIANGRMVQHAVAAFELNPATAFLFENNDVSLCPKVGTITNGGNLRISGNYNEGCGTGVVGNTDELYTFINCGGVVIDGANGFSGLSGVTWRDQKHMHYGLAFYGCRDVTVHDTAFTYFLGAAIYFDAECAGRNHVYDTRFASTFAPTIGVPVIDASGTVEVDLEAPPRADDGYHDVIENLIPAPSNMMQWTAGADTSITVDGVTSPPPGGAGAADLVTFATTGSGREITRLTDNVIGGADKAMALRFWVRMDNVDISGTQSGYLSLAVGVFDGATELAQSHVALSPGWQFIELPFVDTNPVAHQLNIAIAASNLVYVAGGFGIAGVQVSDARAPYVFCGKEVGNAFSRAGPLSFSLYPRAVVGRGVVHLVDIGNQSDPGRTHQVGDRYNYPAPMMGGAEGLICVMPGTPGIFVERGAINATSPDLGPDIVTSLSASDWAAGGATTIEDDAGTGAVKITYVDTSTAAILADIGAICSVPLADGTEYLFSFEAWMNTGTATVLINGATQIIQEMTATVPTTIFVTVTGRAAGEYMQVRNMGVGEVFYMRNFSVYEVL